MPFPTGYPSLAPYIDPEKVCSQGSPGNGRTWQPAQSGGDPGCPSGRCSFAGRCMWRWGPWKSGRGSQQRAVAESSADRLNGLSPVAGWFPSVLTASNWPHYWRNWRPLERALKLGLHTAQEPRKDVFRFHVAMQSRGRRQE